jgi:hypothetical protein
MKTSELAGAALDYVVRILLERVDIGCPDNVPLAVEFMLMRDAGDSFLHPSTDWAQGGPIIELEKIDLLAYMEREGHHMAWRASRNRATVEYGPTPLIAAMRCYVASKLGDEVEVPDGLI